MFTKKEVTWIIIAIIIFGFVIEVTYELELSFIGFLWASLIILPGVFIRKIAASHYSIKIEHKIWMFKQFGWYKRSQLKKPFPIGLLIPFFVTLITLGSIKILTLLQFDAENLRKKRALKYGAPAVRAGRSRIQLLFYCTNI